MIHDDNPSTSTSGSGYEFETGTADGEIRGPQEIRTKRTQPAGSIIHPCLYIATSKAFYRQLAAFKGLTALSIRGEEEHVQNPGECSGMLQQ